MIRNILSYTSKKSSEYEFFNKLIHGRLENFENITIGEICTHFRTFDSDIVIEENFKEEKFLDSLIKVAELSINNDAIDLEEKIVISLLIRVRTEIYLREKLNLEKTKGTPLWQMLLDAQSILPEETDQLKRVNLITPEHIHINSFMYEPLIDLDKKQIINLYESINKIIDQP